MTSASPLQLSLFESVPDRLPSPEHARAKAEQLAFSISGALGMPVRLVVTDNRSTMVSFRRAPSGLRLNVHHMFLDAPEPVRAALASYAGKGHKTAGRLIDAYIRSQQPRIREDQPVRAKALECQGRIFDLRAIFDRINVTHFDSAIGARIGWGRMTRGRRRRSIRLGVYDHQTREIRIHPALDRPEIPAFFVDFIVFHEMLHELFPSPAGAARRVHHPPAFREREKRFPDYAQAVAWEKEHLGLLLRA